MLRIVCPYRLLFALLLIGLVVYAANTKTPLCFDDEIIVKAGRCSRMSNLAQEYPGTYFADRDSGCKYLQSVKVLSEQITITGSPDNDLCVVKIFTTCMRFFAPNYSDVELFETIPTFTALKKLREAEAELAELDFLTKTVSTTNMKNVEHVRNELFIQIDYSIIKLVYLWNATCEHLIIPNK